ncbi:MAG: hypothetical protein WED01_00160 [Candidatus Rokuibacteriota bacterium]
MKPAVLVAAVGMLLCAAVASAQSPAPRTPFDRLAPGHQKIAQALFLAQTTPAADAAAAPLTLDQIAARRVSGQDWGRIFKDMKALGLITDKNLARSVTRYQATLDPEPSRRASATRAASH